MFKYVKKISRFYEEVPNSFAEVLKNAKYYVRNDDITLDSDENKSTIIFHDKELFQQFHIGDYVAVFSDSLDNCKFKFIGTIEKISDYGIDIHGCIGT